MPGAHNSQHSQLSLICRITGKLRLGTLSLVDPTHFLHFRSPANGRRRIKKLRGEFSKDERGFKVKLFLSCVVLAVFALIILASLGHLGASGSAA
jgi:hypothetical protein